MLYRLRHEYCDFEGTAIAKERVDELYYLPSSMKAFVQYLYKERLALCCGEIPLDILL